MDAPVGIRLIDQPDGLGVAVEDREGEHRGIMVPPSIKAVLEEFLPKSGTRFLDFWRSYEQSRGGDAFFEDLKRLTEAISGTPEVRLLRKLANAPNAGQWLHNAYQAQLMAAAHRKFGSVDFDRDESSRQCDFVVRIDSRMVRFEVKALYLMATVDFVDEGFRVSAKSVHQLHRALHKKTLDGLEQAGLEGSVFLPVWCNHLGQALSEHGAEWTVSLEETLRPSSISICLRDADGADRWLRFDSSDWRTPLQTLCDRIASAPPTNGPLPLSGGSIGFTRASRWASVGRIVSINNLRDAYGDDELDHALQMIDRTRIIDADLTQLADLARLAIDAQRLCISSLDQQPIDTGSYSGQQIISDRRFRACGMRSWPGP